MDAAKTRVVAGAAVEGEELVARARAMVPALRERAAATEAAGRVLEATIQDAKDADLFRAAVPKRFGGHEVDYKYIPQIIREWGRGCTSTSWVLGFLMYHNFQYGHFPEEAQQEVWGPKGTGYTMSPGQVMPNGVAKPVEGGYQLSGMWPYASGIHNGDFMLMSAPIEGSEEKDGKPEIRRFFVPIKEMDILDTWHVSAMQGSGSNNVVLENVFVPEHRSVNVEEFREGRCPGLALNAGPLWRIPTVVYLNVGAVGVMIGAAEAIVEMVSETLEKKVGAYSGARLQQQMTTRLRLANNKMKLDATRSFFDSHITDISDKAGRKEQFSREERLKTRMIVSYIAHQAAEIVHDVGQMAGSRAKFLDSPIQRFQRDIASLDTHAFFELDHIGDLYGGTLMGQEVPPEVMI
jgi:3-hydroxy-9,10-secoandrosta-1,3,5(10)-triene-9,17-dione monooxygenase